MTGPAADATDAPQPWRLTVQPYEKDDEVFVLLFHFNGAPVEWNWQGKTEVLGEKPVPVPLCPPQIPHGLTRDRTRASAVTGRRLTVWAMARPSFHVYFNLCFKQHRTFPFQILYYIPFVALSRQNTNSAVDRQCFKKQRISTVSSALQNIMRIPITEVWTENKIHSSRVCILSKKFVKTKPSSWCRFVNSFLQHFHWYFFTYLQQSRLQPSVIFPERVKLTVWSRIVIH